MKPTFIQYLQCAWLCALYFIFICSPNLPEPCVAEDCLHLQMTKPRCREATKSSPKSQSSWQSQDLRPSLKIAIHTRTHTYTHVCIHTYIYTHMHTPIRTDTNSVGNNVLMRLGLTTT